MPASTNRTLRLAKSGYLMYASRNTCKPYPAGSYFTAAIGRQWSGNQRRKREGFNPPTACSSVTWRPNIETIHQGSARCQTVPAFAATGPQGPGSGTFGNESPNGSQERAVQSKALARFVSNAGAGVTLAETAGTLRSLGDRLAAVVSILRALRKGDIRKALSVLHQHTGYNTSRAEARLKARADRNFTDRASSFWLETTFGWIPLLQSVYDSLEELGKDYKTARRSRASDSHNGLRAGIAAEFRTSDGNRFSKLGITNPGEIAWDLVSFSFVLDWFIPVANSIRLLGVRRLVTQIWMWSSRKWETRVTVSSYLGAPAGTPSRLVQYYARAVSIPSYSTFTARLPDTMWHAVTSAALIQSLRPR